MLSYKLIIKDIDKFFFEKKQLNTFGLLRIFWFGLLFFQFFLEMPYVNDFYGPHSITSLKTTLSQFHFPHLNIFQFSNGGYAFTYGLFLIYGMAILGSIIGYYSRLFMIITFMCMVSLHQRNIWFLSSSEVLVRISTLYLIFSPAGKSFSVDAILNKRSGLKNEILHDVWPLRLLQIQLSVVYLWTFWHKLKGETWFDGTAFYYASRLESFYNNSLPLLMNSSIFLKSATWLTLVMELFLGIAVWIKEWRVYAILMGIIFHLSIEFLMSIPYFEWVMILLLLTFIEDHDVLKLKSFFRKTFIHFKLVSKRVLAFILTGL